MVCVTLSQVIITLRVSHPIKEGCVLCRCGQEPCGNRCARGEGGASCPLPLRTELPKNEPPEYCRCHFLFPQRLQVPRYRTLELLSNASPFPRVGVAIKVLVFQILDLFVKKLKWVGGKAGKEKQ